MDGQQGDWLIREIVRRSDEVLRVDPTVPPLQTDSDPSSWVFSFTPQTHTGGRTGMGGRPAGTTIDVRRHFSSLLQSVLSARLLKLHEDRKVTLTNFFDDRTIARLRHIRAQGLSNLYKTHFAPLHGNMLGVYVKFTQRDSLTVHEDGTEVIIANARDRHLLCLWIDRQGKVRCSCIGRTLFTAKSINDQFAIPCCNHAKWMYSFFESLLPTSCSHRKRGCLKLLSSVSKSFAEALPIPKTFTGFKGNAVFVSYKDHGDFSASGEQWVPIRVNTKRKGALTCAFCDMRSETNCTHISEWKRARDIGFHDESRENETDGLTASEDEKTINKHLDDDYHEEYLGRSYLPIGPVNCPVSVKFDNHLAAYLKANISNESASNESASNVYVVPAPQICYKCKSKRDELTRKELDEGILSCTSGPVRMRVESFRCSNSHCGSVIIEEGRSKHIVFYSFTSAATHAFMRREMQAMVLSGGTITNRFNTYVRNRLEDRSSGVLPKDAILRGIKTLTNLFALTVKLMVMEPSPWFFQCETCGVQKNKKFSAVCVDGIWAGYDRSSTQALVSISERCDPIPSGRVTSHRARPNNALLRSDIVAGIISSAIKGDKKDMISDKTVRPALSALRVMHPEPIPENWNVQPIFSHVKSGREMEDILLAFRDFTFLLFKRDIVAQRMAKAMKPYLQKRMHRSRRQSNNHSRTSRKRSHRRQLSESDLLSNPSVVHRISIIAERDVSRVPVHTLAGENEVCWSDEAFAISQDSRRNLYNLYMLILERPLTQFVLSSETESLRKVASLFSLMKSTISIRQHLLRMREDNSMNIIKSNKFLMGSLLSFLELKDTARNKDSKIMEAVGKILHAVCDVVSCFYDAYGGFDESEASAMVYRKRWERASPRLFRSYLMKNSDIKRAARGFNDLFRSGVFFLIICKSDQCLSMTRRIFEITTATTGYVLSIMITKGQTSPRELRHFVALVHIPLYSGSKYWREERVRELYLMFSYLDFQICQSTSFMTSLVVSFALLSIRCGGQSKIQRLFQIVFMSTTTLATAAFIPILTTISTEGTVSATSSEIDLSQL